MKRSKFTEAQIAFALRQSETVTRVEEICWQMGVSQGGIFQLEETIRWFRRSLITQTAAGGR